jgi:hypothetical protein
MHILILALSLAHLLAVYLSHVTSDRLIEITNRLSYIMWPSQDHLG